MNVFLLAGNPSHIYSIRLVLSHHIDIDRHNGQLSFPGGILPAAYQALTSRDEVNLALATAGIFLTCYILTSLGYFSGLSKSKLTPKKAGAIPWFCFRFRMTGVYFVALQIEKFFCLVKESLPCDTLDLSTLQKFGSKCVSMSLAIPDARLYVNEINLAVSWPLDLRDL